jgi:hypothetical protein
VVEELAQVVVVLAAAPVVALLEAVLPLQAAQL